MNTPKITADTIRTFDTTERAERAARGCVRCRAPLGSCRCPRVSDAEVARLLAGYGRLCDRHLERAAELVACDPHAAGEQLADAGCLTTTAVQVAQVTILQAAVDAALGV